jgi:hypothetical protein
MGQRLTFSSKLNLFREGAAKASPNRATQLLDVDPKPDDLLMARMKVG